MVLIEAFAHGVPVVASDLGAMAEIVDEGVTGLLFEPGDPRALAAKAPLARSASRRTAAHGQGGARPSTKSLHAGRQLRAAHAGLRTGHGQRKPALRRSERRRAASTSGTSHPRHARRPRRVRRGGAAHRGLGGGGRREPLRLRRQRPHDDGGLRRPRLPGGRQRRRPRASPTACRWSGACAPSACRSSAACASRQTSSTPSSTLARSAASGSASTAARPRPCACSATGWRASTRACSSPARSTRRSGRRRRTRTSGTRA